MPHRSKAERLAAVERIRHMAKLMPNACVICHEPVGKADYHQITLRDFQGQGLGAEDDATLDNVPMCKLCLAMVLGATSAVLTERQRRS